MSETAPVLRTVDARLAAELTGVVAAAADAILAIAPSALHPRAKADRTPVTAADEAADAVIAERLAGLLPGIVIVSEENAVRTDALGDTFVLVDPLDGTKEFVAGHRDYTVNLAIVTGGRPIAGFMAVPAFGLIYRGIVGRGAERLDRAAGGEPVAIRCRRTTGALTAVVSRSHPDPASSAFLDRLGVAERTTCGSALKFCRLAEGAADIYPRLAPISEWDIAAGDAIVTAAGGSVSTPAGEPMHYGRWRGGFTVPGFIAWADPARQVSAGGTSKA